MEKKRFLDFLDMLDGGGAGQMGDKFEGGGLLSVIGNAFGSPYGSEDPELRAARQAFYGSDQIGGAPMTSAPPPQVIPQQDNYTVDAFEPNYADRFGVPAPAAPMQYGPPARALVGPQLRAAMNPPRAGVFPAPVSAGPSINPANASTDNYQRFVNQLIEMRGEEEARQIISSGLGVDAYRAFQANNYNMPNY